MFVGCQIRYGTREFWLCFLCMHPSHGLGRHPNAICDVLIWLVSVIHHAVMLGYDVRWLAKQTCLSSTIVSLDPYTVNKPPLCVHGIGFIIIMLGNRSDFCVQDHYSADDNAKHNCPRRAPVP